MNKMSEFTNGGSPYQTAASDKIASDVPNGIPTDVPDVFANGERNGLPVFDVSQDEFYQNMNFGRKRLRFGAGTPVQQYMQKTRYNRPFMIRHNEYVRKVK